MRSRVLRTFAPKRHTTGCATCSHWSSWLTTLTSCSGPCSEAAWTASRPWRMCSHTSSRSRRKGARLKIDFSSCSRTQWASSTSWQSRRGLWPHLSLTRSVNAVKLVSWRIWLTLRLRLNLISRIWMKLRSHSIIEYKRITILADSIASANQ